MRAANWKDYELIDTGSGERLERWGDILLIRPDPQIDLEVGEKRSPLAFRSRALINAPLRAAAKLGRFYKKAAGRVENHARRPHVPLKAHGL